MTANKKKRLTNFSAADFTAIFAFLVTICRLGFAIFQYSEPGTELKKDMYRQSEKQLLQDEAEREGLINANRFHDSMRGIYNSVEIPKEAAARIAE